MIQAAGTLGLNVSTIAITFGVTLLLSRLLGAGGLGAYAFALAWAALLSVPATAGLTQVVIRYVAGYSARSEWGLLKGLLQRSNQAVALSSLVLCLAGAIGAWLLKGSEPDVRNALWVGLALVPIASFTSIRQAAISGLGRVVLGRTPETLVGPLLFLIAVAGLYLTVDDPPATGWTVALYVVAMLVAFGLGIHLLHRTLPARVRSSEPAYATGAWTRSALPLVVSGGFMALNAQIGTILLGVLGDQAEVGIYNVATRTAFFVSFFYLCASYPLRAGVARLYATQDLERIQRTLTMSARLVLAGSVPIAVAMIVAREPVLGIFGSEFRAGATALAILAVSELFKVATGQAGLTLVMTGHERDQARVMAAGAAVTVLLSAALIPPAGVEGAAAAMAAGTILTSILTATLLWKRLGLYAPAIGPFGLTREARERRKAVSGEGERHRSDRS